MRRVLVIGSGGAGKSTFAREVAAVTGLPLVHLDRLYWRPAWTPTPLSEWEAVVREAIAAERWVIDGNYGGTLPLRLAAADTAVFLDVPRLICLRRVVWRSLRHLGRTREDMGASCPEQVSFEFWRWVWSYPRQVRPGVLAQLAEFERRGGRAVTLRGGAETRAFLVAMRTAAAGRSGVVTIAGQ